MDVKAKGGMGSGRDGWEVEGRVEGRESVEGGDGRERGLGYLSRGRRRVASDATGTRDCVARTAAETSRDDDAGAWSVVKVTRVNTQLRPPTVSTARVVLQILPGCAASRPEFSSAKVA